METNLKIGVKKWDKWKVKKITNFNKLLCCNCYKFTWQSVKSLRLMAVTHIYQLQGVINEVGSLCMILLQSNSLKYLRSSIKIIV